MTTFDISRRAVYYNTVKTKKAKNNAVIRRFGVVGFPCRVAAVLEWRGKKAGKL